MTVIEKRKAIENYLKKNADERILNLVYALIQEYQNEEESQKNRSRKILTYDDMLDYDNRVKEFKEGKVKGLTIKEVLTNAKNAIA